MSHPYDPLEPRRLLSADPPVLSHVPGGCMCAGCQPPPDAGQWDFSAQSGGAESNVPLSDLPILNSLPGAPVNLLLDFDGRTVPAWGSGTPGAQPAYTTDGDPLSYSPNELANIEQIWRRVAEKFSPFRVNVTTEDPGNIIAGQTFVVMISGTGSWYGNAGGVAFINGFTSGGVGSIGWVFAAQSPNNLQFIAEAAAHEAGHGFGVYHQSTYAGGGLQQEYNPGTSLRAPIMGNSYSSRRGLWWVGPSSGLGGGVQNDLAVLTRPQNVFGYRPDDVSGAIATAAALTVSGNVASGQGVISNVGDVDMFSFVAGVGTVSLSVSGPVSFGSTNIGMLDPSAAILDQLGNVLLSAANADANETLNFNVTQAGQYHLRVSSHGNGGDIGQYLISGTIPPADLPAAPAMPDLVDASDRGFEIDDNLTNDTTPTFTGSAAAGSTIRLYRDLTLVGITTAGPTGLWELTSPPLPDGVHQFNATAEDPRGISQFSPAQTVTIETVAPVATFAGFEYQQAQQLQFIFDEPVAGSLSPTSLGLVSLPSLQPANATLTLGGAGNSVTFTATSLLPDGNYRAGFAPGTVTDAAGNQAVGATQLDFFVLTADANRDRTVAIDDFGRLASNFNRSPRSFSQGDFNYSGTTDIDDFGLLAARFNSSLPPATPPPSAFAADGSARERVQPAPALLITAAPVPADASPAGEVNPPRRSGVFAGRPVIEAAGLAAGDDRPLRLADIG